jgi:hypothetical protein
MKGRSTLFLFVARIIFSFHRRLLKRWEQANNPRYTQAFHDQVLRDFQRSFYEPELPWGERVTSILSIDLVQPECAAEQGHKYTAVGGHLKKTATKEGEAAK